MKKTALLPAMALALLSLAGFKNTPKHPASTMQEGMSDFIEVVGWDENSYKVSIENLNFKEINKTCVISEPEFSIKQLFGAGFTNHSDNIAFQDIGNKKLRYRCYVNSVDCITKRVFCEFEPYPVEPDTKENKGNLEDLLMQFVATDGTQWQAKIKYVSTNSDNKIVLKFDLKRIEL